MYKNQERQRAANRAANRRYRDRKGITPKGITGQGITHVGGAGCAAECELHEVGSVAELMEEPNEPTGPLDVYSKQRWAYLQSKGYVWDESSRRSVSTVSGTLATIVVAVTVPGDPAYARPVMVGV